VIQIFVHPTAAIDMLQRELNIAACVQVRRRHTFGFSINRPGAWRPFDLEVGTHYCSLGGQPCYQFWYFSDFCSWLMGQYLSDGPRDFCDLDFNFGGHDTCGWYGSSCSICVPRL